MGKKLLLLLIAVLLNLTCFTGVLFVSAYLVSNDKIVNSVTVGNSRLHIDEEFESPDSLQPGQAIPKKVRVKNTGLTPCRVRVMTAFSDSNAQKNVKIDYDTDNWSLKEDGYWYYKRTLQPEEETTELFSQVDILQSADVSKLKGFEVIVYGECVNEESGGF